jgi:hypothetical protein
MKITHFVYFLGGVWMMLGVSTITESYAQSRHVYELRMYTAIPGKLDALQARFRDHTDAILKRHNMKAVGYWVPEDPPDSKNLFIYLVEHPSRQEAEKNWAAFVDDPAWKKPRADSEVKGTLVEETNVHRYFMDPTNFSPMK